MSYQIGQYRRESGDHYIQSVTLSGRQIYTTVQSDIMDEISFKDYAFSISGSFLYQNNYCVKIQIKRTTLNQIFSISLANLADEGSSEQFLKRLYIPAATKENERDMTANIEIVFNPVVNFTDLVIRLGRTSADYSIEGGRTFTVVDEGCKCYRILNTIDSISGVSEFNKIGIQGPPGLLMCINGQEIRIGPTGIYETRSGYKITFIGFIITDNNSDDYFMLDYQY